MKIVKTLCADIARALRTGRYERSPGGIFVSAAQVQLGGFFEIPDENGIWMPQKNTVTLQFLDKMLSDWFNGGTPPAAFYIAPFKTNVAPSSALTAASFTATQGEYTAYTQATRVVWTPDGNSASQTVTNNSAPSEFTIGAAATTIWGAGLMTAATKSATTGTLVAAALFNAGNTMNPGSTLKIKYTLAATPAA